MRGPAQFAGNSKPQKSGASRAEDETDLHMPAGWMVSRSRFRSSLCKVRQCSCASYLPGVGTGCQGDDAHDKSGIGASTYRRGRKKARGLW